MALYRTPEAEFWRDLLRRSIPVQTGSGWALEVEVAVNTRFPIQPMSSAPLAPPNYHAKACLTPVGPCVSASGPSALEVMFIAAGGALLIWGGVQIGRALFASR